MYDFLNTVNKMSPRAAKMIFYGLKLATGVLVIGFAAYKYNQLYVGSYTNGILSLETVRAGFSLFVQFIIGGIALDCVERKGI